MSRDRASHLIEQLNDQLDLGIGPDTVDGVAMAHRIEQEWDRDAVVEVIDLVSYTNRYSQSYRDAGDDERGEIQAATEEFVVGNPDSVTPPPDRHTVDVEDGDDLDADDIADENDADWVSFAFPEPVLPGESVFVQDFGEGDQLDFGALGLEGFSEENFDFTTRSEATDTVRVRVGEDVDNFDEPSWFANLVGVDQDVFDQFQDFQDEAIDAGQLIEQVGVALDTEDWLAV
ncbi:hypothetical protein CKO15_07190 [Halorhodospira abdelmalekii]|uniref:hypothetical protein n=1 Tax=Halorhodospira abdelmalekii TaxID=421629 RepID=UPI0019048A39|nr:hypothetical protein [Halorhodospira abdelmalekii]MBK1735072.1 hypothetical protein [Halorhodospira abdelmalekii]